MFVTFCFLIASFMFHRIEGCHRFVQNAIIFREKQELLEIQPCPGDEFCEHPLFYPEDQILKVLSGTDSSLVKMMFETEDEIKDIDSRHRSMMPMLGMESAAAVNADVSISSDMMMSPTKLCPTNSTWIKPRLAKNWRGDWKYIVNRPNNRDEYTQFVYVTTCSSDGSCDPSGHFLRSNIQSTCRQEYMSMKLVALGMDLQTAEIDTFRFPSCCSCIITNNLEWK